MLGKIDANVGAIINRLRISEYGYITQSAIEDISVHYENVIFDKYVIMPNHIHLILALGHGRIQAINNRPYELEFRRGVWYNHWQGNFSARYLLSLLWGNEFV